MFGFFASQEKKMRENAANWLEVADKVWHFRRDLLSAKERTELQGRADALREQVKARADAAKLKLGIESLEGVLRQTGGAIYPKTSLIENIEFFLVAAIVILGIRTYVVQPFKIPTNSMWPTYNGMTPEVFSSPAEEPNLPMQAIRGVAFGAWPHRLDAPADGEVLVPVFGRERRSIVNNRIVPGRTWLVIPTSVREYTLLVGGQPLRVKLPMDFDFDWAIYDAFFARGNPHYSPERLSQAVRARLDAGQVVETMLDGERTLWVRTGVSVKRGERVLAFDEITGDQLFVDRMSYHFVRPSVGSGFVFRTDHIESRYMRDAAGRQLEQYYIKRLVGTPGDELAVKGSGLFRNGAPITGASAFAANARQEGHYPGYQASGLLAEDQTLKVGPEQYFAMGDNSANSQDSRYWGFVPAKDVVGRPIFVYFPFGRHWGLAK